ncbi:hypothetical protein [Streptacidiphilus jiangxiensis]|uniref:Uncharacterized protein n=1 Tax=Streptacidiphilus jiangxiensis TaxID=235985 RepID=A0A1H8A902_STRJI|nr:hypothetical protein [Streptacidiphilus jiangxiensis]SEM66017.1 hypothetical protein SAMN05414137_14130 [Streptacidiphilus jiangxiensis]
MTLSPGQAKLFLAALEDEVADSVTGSDGCFRKADFEAALAKRLSQDDIPPEVRALIAMDSVRARVRNYGDRHRPRRDKYGRVIYDPRTVWKLGNGVWVRAASATAAEGLEAARQSSLNRNRVDRADDEVQRYFHSRLDAFALYPDIKTLDELERTHFGYIDAELPFDDSDEDADDN